MGDRDAAAEALTRQAGEVGIGADRILPAMDDAEVAVSVAVACGLAAVDEGIARLTRSG